MGECPANQVAAGLQHSLGGFEMHRGDAVPWAHRPAAVRGHGNELCARLDAERAKRRDPDPVLQRPHHNLVGRRPIFS